MELFDTHCHLNHNVFRADFEKVLERADHSGVNLFLIPGWDLASSKEAVRLSSLHPQLLAAVGIHPSDWQQASPETLKEIEHLAANPRVVAIGEIGLDYHFDSEHRKEQIELLTDMFSIADKVRKPVLIHSRESLSDIMILVKKWKTRNRPGIIHAFEGDLEQARELIELGFMLGVGGPLTYKNSHTKKDVFSEIPEEAIVLETDCPYLPPMPYRGQRNEPAYLPLIAEQLVLLRSKGQPDLIDSIYKNSYKMFS